MLSRVTEACRVAWRAAGTVLRSPPRRRGSAAGKHLLIVSWHFPPHTATATQLPAFLARHASRTGWQVTVACGPAPSPARNEGLAALRLLPEEVRIVRARGYFDRAGEFHPQFFHALSPSVDGGFAEAVSLAAEAQRALRTDPPTHVFATGPAFGNFLVGRRLARYFGVPLCLQYRDEWTVMRPSFVAATSRDRAEERECLAQADLVTFVTEGKARIYREAFPELAEKRCLVIPNGWDPDVMALAGHDSSHLAHLRGRPVLLFTGRVTEEIPIQPFLEALGPLVARGAPLQNLALCVAGNQTTKTVSQLEAFASSHPGVLELRSAVPQPTAVETMREASALLLLNNTRYPGVVPIKTFDYMASGTPILAFGETGAAGEIVCRTGAGVTVPAGSPEALEHAIQELTTRPRQEWNGPGREAWCEEHNRANLFSRLLTELESLRAPAG